MNAAEKARLAKEKQREAESKKRDERKRLVGFMGKAAIVGICGAMVGLSLLCSVIMFIAGQRAAVELFSTARLLTKISLGLDALAIVVSAYGTNTTKDAKMRKGFNAVLGAACTVIIFVGILLLGADGMLAT